MVPLWKFGNQTWLKTMENKTCGLYLQIIATFPFLDLLMQINCKLAFVEIHRTDSRWGTGTVLVGKEVIASILHHTCFGMVQNGLGKDMHALLHLIQFCQKSEHTYSTQKNHGQSAAHCSSENAITCLNSFWLGQSTYMKEFPFHRLCCFQISHTCQCESTWYT